MNNIFKIICAILMTILILILVWVLVNYYKDDPYTATPSAVVVDMPIESSNAPLDNSNPPEQVDDKNDEENLHKDDEPEQNIIPGNDEPNTIEVKPNAQGSEPVVITSSEKTSNAEKQEVLNEIDKALMELLQVVDKVKGVDETRLGIDESEVQ